VQLLGGRVVGEMTPVVRGMSSLLQVIEKYNANRESEPHVNAVLRAARTLHDALTALRTRVGDAVAYPFEHAQEGMTLGRFVFPPQLPDAKDVGGLLEVGREVYDRLVPLYTRALGRLCLTAEEVERALGLEPLVAVEDEAEA
jgi:hypothetical protein